MAEPETRREWEDDGPSLLDCLYVIRKHWRVEIGVFLAAVLAVATVSLLLPKEYEATASVLPPPETQGGGALGAILSQSPGGSLLGGLLPIGSNRDLFISILRSRTMKDDVIKRFDLVKVYGFDKLTTPLRSAREKLEEMTDVSVSKENAISVTARAYEPRMAADIANFYVENLDRLNTTINITDAGRTRLFLEARVAETHKALSEAEGRLKEYQSRSKAVVLEGQTKAVIEGAATLEGQILAAEVQLKVLETYSTPRNPDVIRLKEGIAEMRQQLKRMEYGRQGAQGTGQRAEAKGGTASDFMVPLGSIPSTGLDLARLVREAKIQETIFTLLAQQLEQARIAEAKDTPMVKGLDRAVVPESKSRPKVGQNVAIAGIVSVFVGAFLAFFLEHIEGIRRRERGKGLAYGS
jgi:uncharacterized protein involved in exopolysaccharide biosynthesis